jgi:hypothetical protein
MQKSTLIMIFLMYAAFYSQTDAAKPILKSTINAISCSGKADGSIFMVYTSDPGEVTNLSVTDTTNNIILNLAISHDTSFQINNLRPGKYGIQYNYKGKPVIRSVNIENKSQLKANVIQIKELSVKGTDIHAALEVNPTGGTPPYLVQWSENTQNQQGEIARNLPQGIYRCTVNDANNCGPVSATFFLYEPEIEKFRQKTKSNN